MLATAQLLDQRSEGHVRLRMERGGAAVLREAGSSKVRVPRGSHEAILINVSGGLAGGDTIAIAAETGEGARLSLTTQAAERVYRTLGPAANIFVSLKASAGSTLLWLPQETIFFEGSALSRRLDVELAGQVSFLAVEHMVFGRQEMGEVLRRISVEDRWTVRQHGKLVHAEAFKLGPDWPNSMASFGQYRAAATLLFVSPRAETLLDAVRAQLGPQDGASAWNGKLVARFLAKDNYTLRTSLVKAICPCLGGEKLPRCWSF
jgi:urease accessory protein